MKIVFVLIAGLSVFILLKIVRWLLKKVRRPLLFWGKAENAFPAIEITLWTVFGYVAAGWLAGGLLAHPYLVLDVLFVLAIALGWIFLRDLYKGVLYKIQNNITVGNFIQAGDLSGRIKSIHLTHLIIVSDNGKPIKIPFKNLNSKIISSLTNLNTMGESKISLEMDKQFSKKESEQKIRHQIAQSPWCTYSAPASINCIKEDENRYYFEVALHTLNLKHLKRAEMALRNHFETW